MKKTSYEMAFRTFLKNREWRNAYECLRNLEYKHIEEFRRALGTATPSEETIELYRLSYDMGARVKFDDFMLALEWNRPVEQQFWQPRRSKLMMVCEALQDLADDKLDELVLNMPPRVGKSTIVMFFVIWWILNHPEEANLYGSYGDTPVATFYDGVMEVLEDPWTYRW